MVHPIYNLTLTGPAREAEYANSVVLSRSRYTAPADRSLRFYREYFQPVEGTRSSSTASATTSATRAWTLR